MFIGIFDDLNGEPNNLIDSLVITNADWLAWTDAGVPLKANISDGLTDGATYYMLFSASTSDDANYAAVMVNSAGTYGHLISYDGGWIPEVGTIFFQTYGIMSNTCLTDEEKGIIVAKLNSICGCDCGSISAGLFTIQPIPIPPPAPSGGGFILLET